MLAGLLLYGGAAAAGPVLLWLVDAACARTAPRRGRLLLLNAIYGASAALAGAAVLALPAEVGGLERAPWLTSAASGLLLYALKGHLYARFGVAFWSRRLMQLVSAAVACLPGVLVVDALSGFGMY